MEDSLELRVLGPFEARIGERTVPLPPMQRRLLANLLSRAGRQFGTDELVEAVWSGAPPRSAVATLQVHLHRLRRALGGTRHITRGVSGYRTDLTAAQLDSLRFELLVDRARGERGDDPRSAAETMLAALELWRGAAYEGIEPSPPVTGEAVRLEGLRTQARRELNELRLDLGRPADAAGPLAELVGAHPFDERLAALLMLALYRSGRQAEALEVFRAARGRLVQDLGVEPGALLRRMHTAVLRGDSRLAQVSAGGLDVAWPPAAPPAEPSETARPEPEPVPRELPMRPHRFTGRERDIAALDRALDGAGPPLALITGMGGIGKTALAVHWGHEREQRFDDGQLYVDLRGQGQKPLEPLQALTAMLSSLGVPAARIPSDTEQAAARFRSRVGERRMLIVLDNAASGAQVRPLLPGGSGAMTLVTSRHRLTDLVARHGGTRLTLDPLRPEEARSLIVELLPAGSGDHGAAELARLCGRLPLAIQIAAANLADNPQYDAASYAARLREGDRLGSLRVPGSPDAAIAAVFASTYRGLPERSARLFRLLSLMPGLDFTAEAAAHLAGTSTESTELALDRLVAVHLVEHHRPGRYRFHDLLRLYAEACADEHDADDADAAEDRLFGWYLHWADACRRLLYPEFTMLGPPQGAADLDDPTADEAAGWQRAESENLVAAVRFALRRGRVWTACSLYDALGGHMWQGVHNTEALNLGRHVLAAAEGSDDPLAAAAAELNLAWTLLSANRTTEAVEHAERAARLATRSRSRSGRAAADHLLAFAYAMDERPREALGHARAAMVANRELGRSGLERGNLEAMGGICLQLGRLDDAVEHFDQLLDRLDPEAVRYEQSALINLGWAHLLAGRPERARRIVTLVPGTETGATAPGSVSARFRVLACADLLVGRLDEAMANAREALSSLGPHPARVRETTVRLTFAHVLLARGEVEGAFEVYGGVLELAGEVRSQFRLDAMLGRCEALLLRGDREQALSEATEACRAARDSGYAISQVQAHNLLARIAFDGGESASAKVHADAALRLSRATGHRLSEANALRHLGRAASEDSHSARAARLRSESAAVYAAIGAPVPD